MERVLMLSRDEDLSRAVKEMLRRFGVDRIDFVTDLASMIPPDELSTKYNILIVDKVFLENGSKTATLVRQIRKGYFDPIIGLESHHGDGTLFSLQVAGCNFCLSLPDHHPKENGRQLQLLIGQISGELKRSHQENR